MLQGSLRLVGGCVNTLCSLFLAVFLFQNFLEYTERDSGLCGGTGLGNHVDGEISVSHYIHKVLNIGRADGVSYIINFRCLADALVYHVVEAVS